MPRHPYDNSPELSKAVKLWLKPSFLVGKRKKKYIALKSFNRQMCFK